MKTLIIIATLLTLTGCAITPQEEPKGVVSFTFKCDVLTGQMGDCKITVPEDSEVSIIDSTSINVHYEREFE